MAVAARDIPITRDMVQDWINEYNREEDPDGTLEEWIRGQVHALELKDAMVNTVGHDNLEDETHVADMIIADLPSYATGN